MDGTGPQFEFRISVRLTRRKQSDSRLTARWLNRPRSIPAGRTSIATLLGPITLRLTWLAARLWLSCDACRHGSFVATEIHVNNSALAETYAWGTIGKVSTCQPTDAQPSLRSGKWVYPDERTTAEWGNHGVYHTDVHGYEGKHDYRVTAHEDLGEPPPNRKETASKLGQQLFFKDLYQPSRVPFTDVMGKPSQPEPASPMEGRKGTNHHVIYPEIHYPPMYARPRRCSSLISCEPTRTSERSGPHAPAHIRKRAHPPFCANASTHSHIPASTPNGPLPSTRTDRLVVVRCCRAPIFGVLFWCMACDAGTHWRRCRWRLLYHLARMPISLRTSTTPRSSHRRMYTAHCTQVPVISGSFTSEDLTSTKVGHAFLVKSDTVSVRVTGLSV